MKTSLNTMRFGYIPRLKCIWWRFVLHSLTIITNYVIIATIFEQMEWKRMKLWNI